MAWSIGCLRELAVEAGNDLANGLGSTGRRGNDVRVDGTSTTPILVGGSINGLLGGGRGMNGAHQTFHDAEIVVYDLCKGRQAVSRTGRVGNLTSHRVSFRYMRLIDTYHSVFGVVCVKIDTANKHGCVCRGRRDDNLLGTTLQVGRRPSGTVPFNTFSGRGQRHTHFSTVVKTPDDSTT